ncbi:FAD binding domain-containing protein [Paraphaeosphaeria sporulosa]
MKHTSLYLRVVFESCIKPAAISQPTSQEVSTLTKKKFAQDWTLWCSKGDWACSLQLERHSLTTPGGRVGRVGVTVLILGGGTSFHSTKHGFACDSLLDYEAVLASGDVIHANAIENTDLFISLKAGLNIVKTVTAFSIKTFPSSEIWGGMPY